MPHLKTLWSNYNTLAPKNVKQYKITHPDLDYDQVIQAMAQENLNKLTQLQTRIQDLIPNKISLLAYGTKTDLDKISMHYDLKFNVTPDTIFKYHDTVGTYFMSPTDLYCNTKHNNLRYSYTIRQLKPDLSYQTIQQITKAIEKESHDFLDLINQYTTSLQPIISQL